MESVSEREYSAHSGLSRGAIQKARKSGRLVVYSDGSIKAAASDARRAEMTDPDQQRRSTGGDSGFSGPADSSSYLKARTALTVYQAQDKQLGIQKKKSTLVDRARAETLVFRIARQERDTWVTWPARVTRLEPEEVWCAAGSGVLARGLAAAWPSVRRHVVQVGRDLTPREVVGAQVHRYPLAFGKVAKINPPFPSDPHYDAKAWEVFIPLNPAPEYWHTPSHS